MANQASVLLNFIIDTLQADSLVNTIVFKDDNVVDVEKENIYPLVSLQLLSSPSPFFDQRQYRLGFEIFNQRDDTKTATPSKLLVDTNYIDNVGITDSIGNNFIMEIQKNHNDFDIDIVEVSNFIPIRKDERNNLDGWKFEVLFSMHQNNI